MILLAFALSGLATAPALRADEPLEYAVKAVFLFKFGDYVEWKSGALPANDQPFVIGVLGQDPFGADLDKAVHGRNVQGHPIVVKRFANIDQVAGAQILYISPGAEQGGSAVPEKLAHLGILTVSDGQAQQGAVINFVIQSNKVRFEIDADAAARADLRLSSKLLSLATKVRKAKPPR